MRVAIFGMIISTLASTAGLLYAYGTRLSVLESWKLDHTSYDKTIIKEIKEDIEIIRRGQETIIDHLLRGK